MYFDIFLVDYHQTRTNEDPYARQKTKNTTEKTEGGGAIQRVARVAWQLTAIMRIGPRSNSQRDDMTFPPWRKSRSVAFRSLSSIATDLMVQF